VLNESVCTKNGNLLVDNKVFNLFYINKY
jgi:hypothetical protein